MDSTGTTNARPAEWSILGAANVLLRRRRFIAAMIVGGAFSGLIIGLLGPKEYVSSAVVIPHDQETTVSGSLAAAAGQFGIRLPAGGEGWGPAVYVELLRSRAILEPIALDTISVAELDGRQVSVMDLLEVDGRNPSERLYLAVDKLKDVILVSEDIKLGAVKVTVKTRWPSVSLHLAEDLLQRLNRFNLETRRSQATAEREYAGVQAAEAERALREAEDRLQAHLQRNRATVPAAEVAFERDRLERQVALRQQIFTQLTQHHEEAKLREVRNTPVFTVLAAPRLALVRERRGSVLKAMFGVVVAGAIAVGWAFLGNAMAAAKRTNVPEAHEFFELVGEVKPRFLVRR